MSAHTSRRCQSATLSSLASAHPPAPSLLTDAADDEEWQRLVESEREQEGQSQRAEDDPDA